MATEDFKYLLTDDTGQTIATAEQARNTTLTQIKDALGTFNSHMAAWAGALSSLTTGDKSSLVNAINWVLAKENTHESTSAMHDVYDYLDAASNGYYGAGIHNSLYRGKNLGSSLTADQFARINDGTFKGLWLGDYIEKEITFNYLVPPVDSNGYAIAGTDTTASTTANIVMNILHFDYFYNVGDNDEKGKHTHHAIFMPRWGMYPAPMNKKANASATDSTAGGYAGSDMRTKYLAAAETVFNSFFGANHILLHEEVLSNAVTNGRVTGCAKYDCKVELMDTVQLYGRSMHNGELADESALPDLKCDHRIQFAACKLITQPIGITNWCWLRNVASATKFAFQKANFHYDIIPASYIHNVKPYAAIC